MQMNKIK